MSKPVVLCILDGWGVSGETEWNAIAKGETPFFDRIDRERPPVTIAASAEEVGLPPGQMGNSEVGHLNIGAGRVVYQDIMRVNNAIADGSILDNPALTAAMERAADKGTAFHLIGLLSDGGVHSHIDHIAAFVRMAKDKGVAPEKILIHALTDGRDTPPDSGRAFVADLETTLQALKAGRIASVMGRFYAMDRDKRWDRVAMAYDAWLHGTARLFGSADAAIAESYERKVEDEFIEPTLMTDGGEPFGLLSEGDEIVMFNFRSDRMREIVSALYDPAFDGFDRRGAPLFTPTTLTRYKEGFPLPVAFDADEIKEGLGRTLAAVGKKQLRTAETEKYAHVTFFFNGGIDTPNEGEDRKLVPSPKVRTYDLQPSMSCPEVTDGVVAAIEAKSYDLIVVNLANGDMVGHTGVWEAALQAVGAVDGAVARIAEAAQKADAHLLITADHGNIEKMVEFGKPMTAHTTNPVPFYYLGDGAYTLRHGGRLADIAPTVLALLEIEKPALMTGQSLLEPK